MGAAAVVLRDVEEVSHGVSGRGEVASRGWRPTAVRQWTHAPRGFGHVHHRYTFEWLDEQLRVCDATPIWNGDSGAPPHPDFLDNLGDEIATLAAHIQAATYRLLALIAEFDRLRGWEPGGYPSCAHWLHARAGIDMGTAREKVRAARALETLPLTSAAMSRGQLSFSQVRALTRVATAANEGELLDFACGAPTSQLERMVRAWKRGTRRDEAQQERALHASRTFSVFPDDEGMYLVRGRLTPEIGALLMRAIEAASDALYKEPSAPWGPQADSHREAAQRRADAVGLLAERALAAGFGECGAGTARPCEQQPSEGDQGLDTPAPPPSPAPISGSRAQRYQVILYVDSDTLAPDAEPGRSHLEDGTRVSAETSRRLSCDTSVVRVTHRKDGSVIDVGRRTRTIPPALRRALDIRDQGCRFPGCGRRFTDAHHVRHWADGGSTNLENCMLLCRFHHRLVHEEGWRVEWWGVGRPMFYSPRGEVRFDGGWKAPVLPENAAQALVTENRRRGIDPDAWTGSATWKSEEHIPYEVYARAMEAL